METTHWDDELDVVDVPVPVDEVDELVIGVAEAHEGAAAPEPPLETDPADWVDQQVEVPLDDDGYPR